MGALVLATLMLPRRLCPGTPSKVADVSASLGFSFVGVDVADADAVAAARRAAGELGLLGVTGCPSLSEAALDILGAIVGAAVDATVIVVDRLWPGTLANVSASRSLLNGVRALVSFFSTAIPARSAAERVVLGTMSGLSMDAGIGLARKGTAPFPLLSLGPFPWLLPLTVDVVSDRAYPAPYPPLPIPAVAFLSAS